MVQRLCAVHLKNHSDIEDIFQTVFLKYLLYPEEFTLEGKTYDDAIEELLKSKKFKVYQEKDNDLTFSVVSNNKDQIIKGIENCKDYEKYNAVCNSSNKKEIKEAHSHGMSFGKYKEALKLIKLDSDITLEDCKDMTMKEIHQNCNDCDGTGNGNKSNDGK